MQVGDAHIVTFLLGYPTQKQLNDVREVIGRGAEQTVMIISAWQSCSQIFPTASKPNMSNLMLSMHWFFAPSE